MFWRIPLTLFHPSFFSRTLRPSMSRSCRPLLELWREIPEASVHLIPGNFATKVASTF
jgi:hypothetical protein